MSSPIASTGFDAPGSAARGAAARPFRSRAPWWGGDLQTLRNYLYCRLRPRRLAGERVCFRMPDGTGDRLLGLLNRPDDARPGPLMLLVHGLGGNEDSPYMRDAARHFRAAGLTTLRLNLRGVRPGHGHSRQHYHAGRTEDWRAVIEALPDDLLARGYVPCGFSLGGNTALKFAADHGDDRRLRAVIAVSPPIDLARATAFVARPHARLYERSILRDFVADCLASPHLSSAERQQIARARTFLSFDEVFTAPRNGFRDAADYYRQCSALPRLGEIAVPGLIVQAGDDPVVPSAPAHEAAGAGHPGLRVLLPRGGGHVGFHGRDGLWHLAEICRFLRDHGELPT